MPSTTSRTLFSETTEVLGESIEVSRRYIAELVDFICRASYIPRTDLSTP